MKDLAVSHGIRIDVMPMIQVDPVPAEKLSDALQPFSGAAVVMVFTSANAVHAIAPLQLDAGKWDIYCLSGVTSEAVKNTFRNVAIKAVADHATALAHKILEDKSTSRIVFCCGDRRREELPDLLAAHGHDLVQVVVYHTILTPAKVKERYNGVLFFSPSAVTSFLRENELTGDMVCFTIGPTTAASLKGHNVQIVVSDHPDAETLITNMIDYFKHNRSR